MAAFEVIFDRYRRSLYAYALGMLRERADAEDVVQESFFELLVNVRRIKPQKGVSGWLYRVARNRTIDILRRRQRERSADTSGTEAYGTRVTPAPMTPEEASIRDEQFTQLQQAIEGLPRKERELLVLRFYSGLSFKQIAGIVRRPLGTVLWQSKRTLERLRKQLGRH